MGKIEALNNCNEEIAEVVDRIACNTFNVSGSDMKYLVDRYNENSSDSYTYSQVQACSDCRRHVFKFWYNVVEQWRKQN